MIFSIIVPICNGEQFLRECIDSALSQDMSFAGDMAPESAYEIILLENGSKDGSPKICDEYAAANKQVTAIHKGKIGLYSARQVGIKAAKGDWILALDADDRLRPDTLKKLWKTIESKGGTEKAPDFILFDAAGMGSATKPLAKRPFDAGKVYEGEELRTFKEKLCMDDSINAMWTKCIKRDIAYLGNEDLFLNYGEDLYQTAEYLDRAKTALFLDEILYYYREDATSLSSSYSEVYIDNQKITWGKLDEMVSKWNLEEYVDLINKRKALTCTIAVTKLIYSDMNLREKRFKLDKLLADQFYQKFFSYELPDWAPEESQYVRKMQMGSNSKAVLLADGTKRSIKNWIKGRIR